MTLILLLPEPDPFAVARARLELLDEYEVVRVLTVANFATRRHLPQLPAPILRLSKWYGEGEQLMRVMMRYWLAGDIEQYIAENRRAA